uniref:Uncharacterized protein n=1 Tax=Alexandrium catenella TaxID=2925 RepID=A0A7S1WE35_ALECA|mmetsp:Transcript_52676/g.141041  ORF Transcript_52676/g.141041 Transcript_52676/m.141041 type:complete len:243 (-) Transcript_52676:56-784(-)
MASARALLIVGSLAWCAAASGGESCDGLGDALAAYQQRVQQHSPEGPAESEPLFGGLVPVVQQAISESLAERNGTHDRTLKSKSASEEEGEGSKVMVIWSLKKQEGGTTTRLVGSTGCRGTEAKTTCLMPMTSASQSKIEVALAQPMDNTTTFAMSLKVKVMFFTASSSTSCPVCGANCTGKFFGKPFVMTMPECPITGTWSYALPTDMMSKVPGRFYATWETELKRSDDSVVASYHTELGN